MEFVSILPCLSRVNTIFYDAYQIIRNNTIKSLDVRFPEWRTHIYMGRYMNILALEGRWDLILFIIDEFQVEEYQYVLELVHIFNRNDIADMIIRRCGLSGKIYENYS